MPSASFWKPRERRRVGISRRGGVVTLTKSKQVILGTLVDIVLAGGH